MDEVQTARAYYAALDEHAYDDLADLLAPGFVHYRPDRTIEGRERFVRFMREERPNKRTTHVVERSYTDGESAVAIRGRLLDADGTCLVEFVDLHELDDGTIERIRTYTI